MDTDQHPRLNQIAADEFKKSLLCTLSLSSKELFHSNMIGWLLENNPAFAKKFFEREDLARVSKVEREKFNFDLLVTADGMNYVIENKVKSVPNRGQIEDYKEKARRKKLEAKFILLSLVEPSDEFKRDFPDVRVISYEEIHEWIVEVVPCDVYLESLLTDYAMLLSTLIRIKSLASNFHTDDHFSFKKEDAEILRGIRLFDVAQKIRYSCLAAICDRSLTDIKLPNLDRLKKSTEVALTRSIGLMSIKIRFGEILLIGIQIQGDQYRLSIESTDKSDVQHLAEKLRNEDLWLNPPDPHRKMILKFGKNFKYVYSSVRGKSGEKLVGRVVEDISRLFRDRTKILVCLGINADDPKGEIQA